MKALHLFATGLALALLVCFSATKVVAYTAVTSGDWSNPATWGGTAPDSSVMNQDVIIPTGITVTLDMDVSFSGILSNFTVDGTLTGSNYAVNMVQGEFGGDGSVQVGVMEFTSIFATLPFTGVVTAGIFRNAGAALNVGAVVHVADTLDLASGTLSINSGANVSPQSGSTIKVDAGSITINGGVFNSGNNYHVMYVGTSKTSGVELNSTTLQQVYVLLDDNAQVLTLSGDLRVNGTLYLDRGTLDFSGMSLMLKGDYVSVAGALLDSDLGSDLVIDGNPVFTSGLAFNTGAALHDFTVNNFGAGNVKLLSPLDVDGSLRLLDGTVTLDNGSTLTMNAGSMVHVEAGYLIENGGSFDGTAAYDVEYTGSSNTTGAELTGVALDNVRLALNSPGATLVMGSDAVVHGMLDLSMGNWDLNGYNLALEGSLDQVPDAPLVGDLGSTLTLRLASSTNDTLYFDEPNAILDALILDFATPATLTMGSALVIATELALSNGRLDLAAHNLVLQSAASITGYSDVNYIVTSGIGHLQMHVHAASPYVTFPVGTWASYSPAMVQQSAAGTSGGFTVRTFPGFLSQGTSGFNYAASAPVVDRTWLVGAEAGMTVDANLRVGWLPSAEVNGFDRTQAYISHYENSMWDHSAPSTANAGANGTYQLTRLGIGALGPFAVADTALVLHAEETVAGSSFALYPNPAHHLVYLSFEDVHTVYQFEVLDLQGKTLLRGEAGQHRNAAVDVSHLSSGCYLLKATARNHPRQVGVKRFFKD